MTSKAKNHCYYGLSVPADTEFRTGDVWFKLQPGVDPTIATDFVTDMYVFVDPDWNKINVNTTGDPE